MTLTTVQAKVALRTVIAVVVALNIGAVVAMVMSETTGQRVTVLVVSMVMLAIMSLATKTIKAAHVP